MSYEEGYQAFVTDKYNFFAQIKRAEKTIEAVEYDAIGHDYAFLATNKMLIEQEFNQLFASLKQDGADRDVFWLYCYYCCTLLEEYYDGYEQYSKVEDFKKLRREIKARCNNEAPSKDPANHESFLNYLGKTISTNLVAFLKMPTQLSKVRDKISFANVSRIYWFFCRTTLTKSFLLVRELQWIDKLSSGFGKEIDIDNIITTLEGPNNFLRALSVGFFAALFLINAGMLLKHTFKPSKAEKSLARKQRFSNEISKRRGRFLNDSVWFTVNLTTNYNEIFHISNLVAGWMVAGFLFFDFCLIMWLHHLAEQDYLLKKAQYEKEIRDYQDLTMFHDFSLEERMVFLRQLREQEKLLDISWQAESSTYWFNATAALLLATGFSASMLLTIPVMVLGCYALCTFATAMYLSDSAYNSYEEKNLLLRQAKVDNKNTTKVLREYKEAQSNLIYTMAKNTIMPTLMITTAALCSQAALMLTVLYMSKRLWNAYSKHAEEGKQKRVDDNDEQGAALMYSV